MIDSNVFFVILCFVITFGMFNYVFTLRAKAKKEGSTSRRDWVPLSALMVLLSGINVFLLIIILAGNK